MLQSVERKSTNKFINQQNLFASSIQATPGAKKLHYNAQIDDNIQEEMETMKRQMENLQSGFLMDFAESQLSNSSNLIIQEKLANQGYAILPVPEMNISPKVVPKTPSIEVVSPVQSSVCLDDMSDFVERKKPIEFNLDKIDHKISNNFEIPTKNKEQNHQKEENASTIRSRRRNKDSIPDDFGTDYYSAPSHTVNQTLTQSIIESNKNYKIIKLTKLKEPNNEEIIFDRINLNIDRPDGLQIKLDLENNEIIVTSTFVDDKSNASVNNVEKRCLPDFMKESGNEGLYDKIKCQKERGKIRVLIPMDPKLKCGGFLDWF